MNEYKFKIGDRVEILVAGKDWPRFGKITATGFSDLTKGLVYKVDSPNGYECWFTDREMRLVTPTPIMKVDMKMEINPSDNAQLQFYETAIPRKR